MEKTIQISGLSKSYEGVFLWKYQRDNCNQDNGIFCIMDASSFAGQSDPKCDQRYLHNHLYDL